MVILYAKEPIRLMNFKQDPYLTTNKKSAFLYAPLVR